jgi:hypothetical protein
MNLPVQSQPVLRNVSDTHLLIALDNGVTASSCSVWKKAGCATAVAACAAVCVISDGLACAACFANLGVSSCIDCL